MNRTLRIDRALLVLFALVAAAGARPAAAAELALIDDIVVDGQRSEEPTAENLSIVVAATGAVQAGRRGMGLSAGDEVHTGAGVQAVLRFLDLDPEVDPLLFIDESSAYEIAGPTTLEGFFGRLFASVAGLFSVITPGGRLGVEGTEFEVRIEPDGAVDIRVLEGVVAFEPSDAGDGAPEDEPARPETPPRPEAPETAGSAIRIQVDSGSQKVVGLALMVANGCPDTESFFVDSPAALPWVRIVADPQPIEVPGNGRAEVAAEIWVDAAGIQPGLYPGAIEMRCADCGDCSLTRRAVPLVVEIVEPNASGRTRSEADAERQRRETEMRRRDEMRAAAESREGQRRAAEQGAGVLRIRALERVEMDDPSATAAPAKMAQEEVVRVLDWTDGVFVAVQPTYPAAGDAPHFEDLAERSEAFRRARYEAVWKRDPEARVRLGHVYKDWGEDRRAGRSYAEAVAAAPSLGDSADLLASWAEANRRAGRLEKAQEQAMRAIELDPRSGRANVALGNVYRGIARQLQESADAVEATPYLERSLAAYEAASRVTDPAAAAGRRIQGVAQTNLAETYTDLARSALAEGRTTEADRRLVEAQQAVRAADSVYSKSENPFLQLAEGQVLQERARLAKARGDEEGSRRQLELAQQSYAAALQKHEDLAPAYYRIATVYEDRGEIEQAEREYEKAVETQPTYTPSYEKLGRLKESRSPGSGTVYLGRDLKLVARDGFVAPPAGTPAVPDLIGMVPRQAEQALIESGFAVGEIRRQPSAGKIGTVVAQRPVAGSRAVAGARVDLTLALPQGSFAMPDLRGLGVEEAERRLAEHGLGPARIRRIEKRGRRRSEVTGQSPRPGKKVSAGMAVELEVTVPRPLKVPDVVGRSYREAVDKLETKSFTLGEVGREPSCESPGRVLRQSPAKGERLPPGSPVALVVAAPAADARPVPGLIGVGRRAAEELLARSGFRPSEVDERESDQPPGTVLAQRPAAQTVLGAGCPVALTVAKPVALVTVPNFVGESLSELQRTLSRVALAAVGLELGGVTLVDTAQQPEGTVVGQRPKAGSRVRRGSAVDLWVARGAPQRPPTVVLPDLRGQPAKRAAEMLREMGLRPTIDGTCQNVRRTAPEAGTALKPGSTVTLITGYCVQ
jgi:beta-lactam-binding protein with PASTA domain/tetratricopeptide (TPR) repeat protein